MTCCAPKETTADLHWLPEPVLDETGDHYLPYEAVKSQDTDEKDRPSLKPQKTKSTPKPSSTQSPQPSTSTAQETATSDLTRTSTKGGGMLAFHSAQTDRATIVCVECQKPRVIYSNTKLSQRQEVLLAINMSEYEYTCGSHLFPPSCERLLQTLTLRPQLTCAQPVELPFYGAELGRKDLCCHCAAPNAFTDPLLKEQYKTVLPICDGCVADHKTAVVQRPFKKAAAKKSSTV